MRYLNVDMTGLRGRNNPCLSNIITTEEVRKLRPYLKFLTGDYLTYQRKFEETNEGSRESESICHVISICHEYEDIRSRILKEMAELCLLAKSKINFENILSDPEVLAQFLLDPASFNLGTRVHISDPILQNMFKISRYICWAIHSRRMKALKILSSRQT